MDQNAIIAFVISFIAGISTLLGTNNLFYGVQERKDRISFTGLCSGVMISVSFSDLLPEAQQAIAAYSGIDGQLFIPSYLWQ